MTKKLEIYKILLSSILHTPLVKHSNDLLERQNPDRGKDEVSYFYVRANFQEKIFPEISVKKIQTLGIT